MHCYNSISHFDLRRGQKLDAVHTYLLEKKSFIHFISAVQTNPKCTIAPTELHHEGTFPSKAERLLSGVVQNAEMTFTLFPLENMWTGEVSKQSFAPQ